MKMALERNSKSLVVSIDSVTVELIDEMIEFGKVYYKEGDRGLNREHLIWLGLSSPLGVSKAATIHVENIIVAQALLIPVDLRVKGSVQRAYFVVHVLAHPEYKYRKMRLFSELIKFMRQFCSERGEWLVGHPNSAALPGWKRHDMTFGPDLRPCLLRPNFKVWGKDKFATHSVKDESDLDSLCGGFFKQLRDTSGDCVELDRGLEFMKWRFFRRPDKSYKVLVASTKMAGTCGFVVTTRWKAGVDLIVDYRFLQSSDLKWSGSFPSIVMLPDALQSSSENPFFTFPVFSKKRMPFFVSSFDGNDYDLSRLTLAASDF